MRIILASSSPRRRYLMELLGMDFEVIPSMIREDIEMVSDFGEVVENIALEKAREVYERTFEERLVIGADTVVVLEGEVLGKPRDLDEARRFLRMLSGNHHDVYTGVAFVWEDGQYTFHERTRVWFREIPPGFIEEYIRKHPPLDKAGGYGIQDLGAVFVDRIEGDYYTVMGLPIGKVWEFLYEKGWWR